MTRVNIYGSPNVDSSLLACSCPPVIIALLLRAEGAMTGHAPSVLLCGLQMSVQLYLAMKTQQTCQTNKSMVNMVVVLKVVLETPLILEGAETQIAEGFVTFGVVNVVLQTIAVFEDTDTKIAIVLVIWCLLDMALKCCLAGKPDVAGATPVLTWIVGLVARCCGVRDCAVACLVA